MSNTVHWVLEVDINPGRVTAFEGVMAQLVSATAKEAGTVAYEWHFSDDDRICHVYERFRDTDAAEAHLRMFAEQFATDFLATCTPTRICVYGRPNPSVVETLSAFSPMYLTKRAGFSKLAA